MCVKTHARTNRCSTLHCGWTPRANRSNLNRTRRPTKLNWTNRHRADTGRPTHCRTHTFTRDESGVRKRLRACARATLARRRGARTNRSRHGVRDCMSIGRTRTGQTHDRTRSEHRRRQHTYEHVFEDVWCCACVQLSSHAYPVISAKELGNGVQSILWETALGTQGTNSHMCVGVPEVFLKKEDLNITIYFGLLSYNLFSLEVENAIR